MNAARTKDVTLTFRTSRQLRDRANAARLAHPFKPTMTAVLERGLELVIDEMEHEAARKS